MNKQASGLDTGWMLPPDHQDLCAGFRQSSFDSVVFFAVSEVQKNFLFLPSRRFNHAEACTNLEFLR